ncbi:sugar transferase [Gracilimonas sp.]|uniref:sugar transferase n=1 Tax=Gracilimonas sp. TaxID=1974203 RepID=UPI003D0E3E3F
MNDTAIRERLSEIKKLRTDNQKNTAKPRIEPVSGFYITLKYVVEYILAVIAFVAFLPLLLFVALLIKSDSKGEVFFKQKRYGHKGDEFMIYKFRTMIQDAHKLQNKLSHLNEMNGGKLFKTDNDPRITRIGRFLRKTSIDELPQLLNILKGDMTVIGPRPISTPLSEYDENQLNRFKVKPGLGCIWQAYFRGETDFQDWMYTDTIYVENMSPKLDLRLMWIIGKNVVLGKGAR